MLLKSAPPASAQSTPAAPASAAASSSAAAKARTAVGLTEPARDAILGAPVAGIVGKHFFKEGDRVGEGAVVMELRNELQQIELGRRDILLKSAKVALERTSRLRKSTKSVSDEDLEQAKTDYAIALAGHKQAQAELAQRQVVAPFAGEITELFGLEDGEIARPQAPLVRLVDTARVHFLTHISAKEATTLNTDQNVTLAFGDESVTGTVEFVSPVVDSSSGLLKVKVVFENPESKIRPGVSGTMTW